jgi:integrase/recombinase XerD
MVKVLRSFVRGPLEAYAGGFVEELFRQGYSRSGAEQHVCFIAHLDRWLTGEGIALGSLTGSVLERYLGQRRASGYVEYRSLKAVQPLLAYLRPLDLLPVAEPVVLGPVEELLGRYREYLLIERGLTVGTARGYVDCVRPFIKARLRGGVLELADLSAGDVTGFVLTACPGRAVGSAKLIVCSLRSLLVWLHLTGVTAASLARSVPSVAGWSLSGLPKWLAPDELQRLLAACDRRTPTGRRDYAIMLLLARLGLRAGEAAGLELEDIDWRRGEFAVRGKGNRTERLPLPVDVGAAITAYLRRGRPETAQGRSVFVRVHAPHRAARAGLGKIHAHRLRHTAATAMLRAGSPLAEVGQVLRHRSALSTAIYAKVDREALATLAKPWPVTADGGVS